MNEADKKRMMRECYDCIHRQEVFYSAHSQCNKPDAGMTGNKHGIKKGWFMYPVNFDPVWKTKLCSNFEAKSTAISESVSDAVNAQ
jgi:hypothetical protein